MTNSERTKYQLYAALPVVQHRFERTRVWIRETLTTAARPYVAVSWGKDSIVLLHLVVSSQPNVDAIWLRADQYDEWIDTERVAREFRARWQVKLHERRTMSVTECYRRAGGFYVFAETEAQRAADRAYGRAFMQTMREVVQEQDFDLAFIGLRAEESRKRRILLKSRGNLLFSRQHSIWECFPLANWNARDIWAYIVANDLPYPNLYDLHPDREHARNGAMFAANLPSVGGIPTYFGQLALLKRMYPDLFNQFATEFPEVRSYV